jgi:hypothetical protein
MAGLFHEFNIMLKAESQRWRQLPYLRLTAGMAATDPQHCQRRA